MCKVEQSCLQSTGANLCTSKHRDDHIASVTFSFIMNKINVSSLKSLDSLKETIFFSEIDGETPLIEIHQIHEVLVVVHFLQSECP